jgi:hypothetical protein
MNLLGLQLGQRGRLAYRQSAALLIPVTHVLQLHASLVQSASFLTLLIFAKVSCLLLSTFDQRSTWKNKFKNLKKMESK